MLEQHLFGKGEGLSVDDDLSQINAVDDQAVYLPKIMASPPFRFSYSQYGKTAVSFSISDYRHKVNETAGKMPQTDVTSIHKIQHTT